MSDQQIASLLISLEANTTKLDEQIKQTRQHFTDLKGAIDLVGTALATLGVVEGIKAVIDAAADAEKGQALLASQIKATGDASGYTTDQLVAMAEGFAHTTTSSKEQVEQLEAELMAFRNIAGDQFKGAIQAALDFSAVTGRDATLAVKSLGMALNDPANGMNSLKKAGIDLSEAMKETIKTMAEQGDLVGAQNVLLQEMEKSYGGAAEAARNTLGGALQGLKHDFTDLLAGDGGGVQQLTDSINDLDKVLQDPAVKQGIANLVAGVMYLVSAAAQAAAAIGHLGENIGEFFAKIQGYEGNFDDQINALNVHIKQTKDQIAGLEGGGTPKDSPAIQQLQDQLAKYQDQLIQVQGTQQLLGIGPKPQTYTAGTPDALLTPDFKTSPSIADVQPLNPGDTAGLKNTYQQLMEDQKKVLELWKQNDPAAYLRDQIAQTQALIGTVANGQIFTADDAELAMQRLEEEWKRHNDAMTEATQNAAQGMQQDLQQFFFDPIQEGLGGLLQAFINTLKEMLAQWAAAQFFNSAFGSYDKTGAGNGAAGFGDLLNGFFGGHRAGGGPVSAGMLYAVNEGGHGTEGFVPSSGGSIVPLGGRGASQSLGGLNVNYTIDARGADGASAANMMLLFPALRRLFHADVEHYASRGVWPA